MDEHGLRPPEVARVADQPREVYKKYQDVPRYTVKVQDVGVEVRRPAGLEKSVG